jgi:hypothetical protein
MLRLSRIGILLKTPGNSLMPWLSIRVRDVGWRSSDENLSLGTPRFPRTPDRQSTKL